MKEFTIDDAINLCEVESKKYEKILAHHANKASDLFSTMMSEKWKQIAEWLAELKELKEHGLHNLTDNGDKIEGYNYAYKTDSDGVPYINIDSVRYMLKQMQEGNNE